MTQITNNDCGCRVDFHGHVNWFFLIDRCEFHRLPSAKLDQQRVLRRALREARLREQKQLSANVS